MNSSSDEGTQGLPTLTRDALARIARAEKAARERYDHDVFAFYPTSPKFSFLENAIVRSLGRVIEHIAVYTRDVVEAHFREYMAAAPDVILNNGELRRHVFFHACSLADEMWVGYKTILFLEPTIRETRRIGSLALRTASDLPTPATRLCPQGQAWAKIWRNLTEAELPVLDKRFDSTIALAYETELARLVREAGIDSKDVRRQGRSGGTAADSVHADLPNRSGSAGDLTRGGSIWRDLESRFRELIQQFGDRLVACWMEASWKDDGDLWSLADFQGNRERVLFAALAERAAKELGHSGGPKAMFYWLDILRAESSHFESGVVTTRLVDGTTIETQTGTVIRLLEASADHCIVLDTRTAVQANPAKQGRSQEGNPTESNNTSGSANTRPQTPPATAAATGDSEREGTRPNLDSPSTDLAPPRNRVVSQTPVAAKPLGPRKRGRPAKIDTETKEAALAVKARDGTWREVAKVLYGTLYPTSQQVKNASNILKQYQKSAGPSPNKS